MADKTLNATVRETGESAYAVEVVVDRHVLKSDQTTESGGKSLGPTPHEIVLAALGACTAETVRWYALRHDIALDGVDVELTYRREPIEGRPGLSDVFDKKVHLSGPSLTEELRAKLLDVAEKCPIQRLLEGSPVIRTSKKI